MHRWFHRVLVSVVLALLLTGCAATTPEPSPTWNDDFADRFVLMGPSGSAEGTNVDATLEPGEPFDVRPITSWQKSVWWSWTAPASGPYTFDTVGSDFDTVLGIYTGDAIGSLVVVGENDDAIGLQSRLTFEAAAGTTYQIAVGSWTFTGAGAIVLNWGPATF